MHGRWWSLSAVKSARVQLGALGALEALAVQRRAQVEVVRLDCLRRRAVGATCQAWAAASHPQRIEYLWTQRRLAFSGPKPDSHHPRTCTQRRSTSLLGRQVSLAALYTAHQMRGDAKALVSSRRVPQTAYDHLTPSLAFYCARKLLR